MQPPSLAVPTVPRRPSLGIPEIFKIRRTESGIREMDQAMIPDVDEPELEAFAQHLEEKNQDEFERVQHIFRNAIEESHLDLEGQGIALATSGSDGREEKTGRFSPLELMIITPGPRPDVDATIDRLRSLIRPESPAPLHTLVSQTIEVKSLNKSNGLINERVFPNAKKTIPSKPLDAKFLAGNRATFDQYKHAFVEEWVQKEARLRDFHSSFVRKELKHLKDQLEKEGPGINSETGQLIFIPHPESTQEIDQRGPKYGATRFLQYSLTKFIVQHIEPLEPTEGYRLLQSLPRSTVKRVEYLQRTRILPLTEEEVHQFRIVYNNLVMWYAILQDRASRTPAHLVTATVPTETLKKTLSQALALGTKILEAHR